MHIILQIVLLLEVMESNKECSTLRPGKPKEFCSVGYMNTSRHVLRGNK